VGLNSLKSLNLTNGYPNKNKNKNKNKNNNKVKSKPLELRSRVKNRKNPFLAASTECSTGSNDHFVVGGGGGAVPSLVQFDGWPLGGANFQY
jgi:hypothetical protein